MKNVRILALSALLAVASFTHIHADTIILEHQLLKIADNAGLFDNTTIINILKVRKSINELVSGKKSISGITINKDKLHTFLHRAELLGGATFVVITREHPALASFVTQAQAAHVQKYLQNLETQTLQTRLENLSSETVFTGSYLANPITGENMPVYISDYALDTFETRTHQMHLGIPAHHFGDFKFAKTHNLPIKLVLNIQAPAGRKDIDVPKFDAQGNLVHPFMKEYQESTLINSAFLNGLSLPEARTQTIQYLEQNNAGYECEELIQYLYDGEKHSMRSLSHIEDYLEEHKDALGQIVYTRKMSELKTLLKYAQADFLQIVEPFLLNVRGTKDLMSVLVDESCKKRNLSSCYLLNWAHYGKEIDESIIIKKDIISLKMLAQFCSELVNFLADLAHSCPHALASIKKN